MERGREEEKVKFGSPGVVAQCLCARPRGMRPSDHGTSEIVRSWDGERVMGFVCWMVVVPCCGLGEWR